MSPFRLICVGVAILVFWWSAPLSELASDACFAVAFGFMLYGLERSRDEATARAFDRGVEHGRRIGRPFADAEVVYQFADRLDYVDRQALVTVLEAGLELPDDQARRVASAMRDALYADNE